MSDIPSTFVFPINRKPEEWIPQFSLGLQRQWGVMAQALNSITLRIVLTAALPAASATMDGTILIEDAGAGNRNLIIYAGGERFRIDGGAAF